VAFINQIRLDRMWHAPPIIVIHDLALKGRHVECVVFMHKYGEECLIADNDCTECMGDSLALLSSIHRVSYLF